MEVPDQKGPTSDTTDIAEKPTEGTSITIKDDKTSDDTPKASFSKYLVCSFLSFFCGLEISCHIASNILPVSSRIMGPHCRHRVCPGIWRGMSSRIFRIHILTIWQILPLMNIIFGHLAQSFNDYFVPNPTMTEGAFKKAVNKYS